MTKEAIPYIGLVLVSVFVTFVVSEGGEKIEQQCHEIYLTAQQFKWYRWNKSNRQLLMLFLLMTKDPISVTCYGFATQNRTLLLKMYRMMQACATYIQSTNTN
uniref:Uncharacterized protein LOC114335602 n=1 Tax=Diabrotica virgifera virgifera TaxID=50390 RepID=A0A6P7FYS0_DIAVI